MKGALVYLPAGVKLYQLSEGDAVTRYKVVPKPSHVLLVGEHHCEQYYSVLYEGENWRVPYNDVYPLKGERP